MSRGITYDEFGFIEEFEEPEEKVEAFETPPLPHIPMRDQFPEAGSDYMGGQSDGWAYKTVFIGATLEKTYQMVRQFLTEEGYGDIPLPENAAELRLFKKTRSAQLKLWAERGYMHNPVKILFPYPMQRNTLILCIYNEKAPNHLLRFHEVLTV